MLSKIGEDGGKSRISVPVIQEHISNDSKETRYSLQ